MEKNSTMAVQRQDGDGLTLYRQPYRITFARWNYTAVEKKILTAIIGALQKEIGLLIGGKAIGQLELFGSNDDTVRVKLSYGDIDHSNNHKMIRKAIEDLRMVNVRIVLPAVKGKKPREQTILTGLIERAVMERYSREIHIHMHRATALEMVNTAHGFTTYLAEVIMNTSSKHTQRLYEWIMHWQDVGTLIVTEEKFRQEFYLTDKYSKVFDLIARVIAPAQKEIRESQSPVYFEFSLTKGVQGNKFNFVIKKRAEEAEKAKMLGMLTDNNKNILRRSYAFDSADIDGIRDILDSPDMAQKVRDKIMEVHLYIMDNKTPVKSPKKYMIKALVSEFRKRG